MKKNPMWFLGNEIVKNTLQKVLKLSKTKITVMPCLPSYCSHIQQGVTQ